MNDLSIDTANPFAASKGGESSALAHVEQSRAVAEVQAAYVVAKRFPRDERKAYDKILQACTRPGLAEAATYAYARGGSDIQGPSIRMAEALAMAWGNIRCGWQEISRGVGVDGVPYSEVRAEAIDMESNYPSFRTFIVRHWRDAKKGGYQLKDERDIYELCANQAARRLRACILALIPGDVIDGALAQCDVTLKAKADVTPEALTKMVEAFGALGVSKGQIEKRIQRRIDAITPALILQLRKIHNSLRDGMSSIEDWFDPDEAGGAPGAASTPEKRAALPALTDEAFAKNLPLWEKAVADKKKTPDQILATVSTRNALTDEQRKRILAIAVPGGLAAADDPSAGAPPDSDREAMLAADRKIAEQERDGK